MRLETQSLHGRQRRRLESNQPPSPTFWQQGRFQTDSFGVHPMCAMEVAVFADVSIDQANLRFVGIIGHYHVHFDRPRRFVWELAIAKGAKYGLAADHDEVWLLHDWPAARRRCSSSSRFKPRAASSSGQNR